MTRSTGKQAELNRVSSRRLEVKLDNGVSVSISFNNGNIHLKFSGIEGCLRLGEAERSNINMPLASDATIKYHPLEDSWE